MWSLTLRQPSARCIQAPGRALSSSFTRGRISPRGPRNSIRRPEPIRREKIPTQTEASDSGTPNAGYDPAQNSLLAPVHIPEDPHAVLKETHPATGILANSGLVVQRQLELMNVMMLVMPPYCPKLDVKLTLGVFPCHSGFEQANKYVIMDGNGNHIGYMAEQEKGMASMMARQWFRTHRGFVTHVFDRHENEVLRVRFFLSA